MFFEKAVLKNFAIFTGKTPVLESSFNKIAGLQACNFIKRDSNTGVFLSIFELFKNACFEEYLPAAASG